MLLFIIFAFLHLDFENILLNQILSDAIIKKNQKHTEEVMI